MGGAAVSRHRLAAVLHKLADQLIGVAACIVAFVVLAQAGRADGKPILRRKHRVHPRHTEHHGDGENRG